jgi:hypothetical protein
VIQDQELVRQFDKCVREQKQRFDSIKQDKQEENERNLKFAEGLGQTESGDWQKEAEGNKIHQKRELL